MTDASAGRVEAGSPDTPTFPSVAPSAFPLSPSYHSTGIRPAARLGKVVNGGANYLGRAFGTPTDRDPQRVHIGIRQTVARGSTMGVFAIIVDPSSSATALEVESRLIGEIRPPWNCPSQLSL